MQTAQVKGYYYSHNTCLVGDYAYSCSRTKNGDLCIRRMSLGGPYRPADLTFSLGRPRGNMWHFSACPLGDSLFLIGLDKDANYKLVYAATVMLDPPSFTKNSVAFAPMRVSRDYALAEWVYLCQWSPTEVMLSCSGKNVWYLVNVQRDEVLLQEQPRKLPFARGFQAVPAQLRVGQLLVAGGDPKTRQITRLTRGEANPFAAAGELPGDALNCPSCTVVAGRFLVGFGGVSKAPLDEMFVFDAEMGRSSAVKKSGTWHPACQAAAVLCSGDAVYILGGSKCDESHSIALGALAGLIQDREVREAFSLAVQGGGGSEGAAARGAGSARAPLPGPVSRRPETAAGPRPGRQAPGNARPGPARPVESPDFSDSFGEDPDFPPAEEYVTREYRQRREEHARAVAELQQARERLQTMREQIRSLPTLDVQVQQARERNEDLRRRTGELREWEAGHLVLPYPLSLLPADLPLHRVAWGFRVDEARRLGRALREHWARVLPGLTFQTAYKERYGALCEAQNQELVLRALRTGPRLGQELAFARCLACAAGGGAGPGTGPGARAGGGGPAGRLLPRGLLSSPLAAGPWLLGLPLAKAADSAALAPGAARPEGRSARARQIEAELRRHAPPLAAELRRLRAGLDPLRAEERMRAGLRLARQRGAWALLDRLARGGAGLSAGLSAAAPSLARLAELLRPLG